MADMLWGRKCAYDAYFATIEKLFLDTSVDLGTTNMKAFLYHAKAAETSVLSPLFKTLGESRLLMWSV